MRAPRSAPLQLARARDAPRRMPRRRSGCSAPQSRVEDLQLGAGERQLAVLVLAVEGEQRAAEVAQVGDGRGAAVEVGARAPVGADAAREHDLLGVGAVEPLGRARSAQQRRGQLEDALDVGLGGAGPHDALRARGRRAADRARARAPSCRRPSRRSARSARAQAQLGPLDQQQVLDAQLLQHRRSSSARRRIGAPSAAAGAGHGARRPWFGRPRQGIIHGTGPERTPVARTLADKARAWLPATPPRASDRRRRRTFDWPAAAELDERLEEEIGRAERHGTPLSCLLVVVENLEELAREHGGELREQTLATSRGRCAASCAASTASAMPSERELLIVLPGRRRPARRDRRAARARPAARDQGRSARRSAARCASPSGLPPGGPRATRRAAARAGARGRGALRQRRAPRAGGARGSPRRAALAQEPPRHRLHNPVACSRDQSCGCCA